MRALRTPAIAFVVCSLVLLGGGLQSAIGNNPVLSFMLLGTFLIHMSVRPGRTEWIATLALAALLRFGYASLVPLQPYFLSQFIHWGSFLGLASLLAMLARKRWRVFLAAGALPYSWLIVAFSLGFTTHTARTYDGLLLQFDSGLGFLPSFVLGQLLAGRPILREITHTVYVALPLGAACLLAWDLRCQRRNEPRPVRLIPMYVTTMILGYLLYWIYPAAGPTFAFASGFPNAPPGRWAILYGAIQPFTAPRNAMPSLHFGAMVLLVWNSRGWRPWARAAAMCFAAAVAFSTLALGEHYLIDLIVAFPFVMATQALWTVAVPFSSSERYGTVAAGLLATAAWLIALRWGAYLFFSWPALAWGSMAVTVAGTIWMERRLARVADGLVPGRTVVKEIPEILVNH
jgi:hypothetical protein